MPTTTPHLDGPNPLHVTPQALHQVHQWLTAEMPGGKYIWPHWQEGPYFVVAATAVEDVNWQAQTILDAHPSLATVPYWDGIGLDCADLRAVSTFGCDTLHWHQGEGELTLTDSPPVGPLDAPPTPNNVLNHLPHILGIHEPDCADLVSKLAPDLHTLQQGGAAALDVLTAVTTQVMNTPTEPEFTTEYDEFEDFEDLLGLVHVIRVSAQVLTTKKK